jgi:hypothetical protein
LNLGSGSRDTARVLGLSTDTALDALKKESTLLAVSQPLRDLLSPGDIEVVMRRADEAEVDEM